MCRGLNRLSSIYTLNLPFTKYFFFRQIFAQQYKIFVSLQNNILKNKQKNPRKIKTTFILFKHNKYFKRFTPKSLNKKG